VTGSSPASGARLARIALAVALAAGCAETEVPPAAGPGTAARTGPDDSDLWNLAPRDAESLAEVDVTALARSPWSRQLVTGGFAEDREQRQRTFGYDVFVDVDRLLLVGVDASSAAASLTVARGRFDAARLWAAFGASTPGARATSWRQSPMWESDAAGGRAVALVTPRTLVQGTPAAVRAAIDAAWGLAPDARGGPLGEVRRALDADHNSPAITIALDVTDDVRARAAGIVDLPLALRRVGARLDVGDDLDVDARAFLDDPQAARVAADTWGAALGDLRRQRMLRMLGMAPLLDGAQVRVEGGHVYGRLHVPERQREALGERLLFLLQTIARERHAQAP
jgi:hypothetical protein